MSRVLITGANGFLGRNLCRRFKERGHEVFCWLRGDTVSSIGKFQPEYVIHCAGEIYNETLMIDSNISLTESILKQVSGYHRTKLKRFIYLGSSSEYGRMLRPSSETDVPNPSNMYEATKTAGALITQAYGKKNDFKTSIVRPYSIFGEFEPPHRFIPTLYISSKAGLLVKIYSGAHDFLYVEDFVNAVELVTFADLPSDIVNVGSGVSVSNELLVETFEKALGRSISRERVSETLRDYDSDFWCANISYAKHTYGWSPKFTLEEGLVAYINSFTK